jgi:hypothetical protein
LLVAVHNGGSCPVLHRHGLRRKEKQHSPNPSISPIYLFLSFLFPLSIILSFLDAGNKVRWE